MADKSQTKQNTDNDIIVAFLFGCRFIWLTSVRRSFQRRPARSAPLDRLSSKHTIRHADLRVSTNNCFEDKQRVSDRLPAIVWPVKCSRRTRGDPDVSIPPWPPGRKCSCWRSSSLCRFCTTRVEGSDTTSAWPRSPCWPLSRPC